MDRRSRRLVALIAVAAVVYALVLQYLHHFTMAFDLSWPLVGARQLLSGHNPWVDTTPYQGFSAYPQYWPLYYPLSALIAVAPLAWLPLWLAAPVFVGISSALLAWALLRTRPQILPIVLSAPALVALYHAQWAPLTVAAALLGAWPLLLCKPTLGLPLLVAYRPTTRRGWAALALGAACVAISLPFGWYHNVRQHENLIPLVYPFGVVVLLALIRWRDPRSLLLVALAAMPQRPGVDQLALGLLCRTRNEAIAWVVATWSLRLAVWLAGAAPDVELMGLYVLALVGFLYTARRPLQERRVSRPLVQPERVEDAVSPSP